MKNTKLIIAMAVALGLASCDFIQPNTNEAVAKVDVVADDVLPEKEKVTEATYEWDFDLMWQVFMAMPYQGYDMDKADTVQAVRQRTKQAYDVQRKKNYLSVETYDPIPYG